MNGTFPKRPKRRFETSELYFHLLRLQDEEYCELRGRSFPIKYNEVFLWFLMRKELSNPYSLDLPKLLVLFEEDFGRSSKFFDTWKQSFSFPFLLETQKSIGSTYYLLQVADYRGNAEFKIYRIIDDVKYLDEDREVHHEPISDEFSQSEIEHIIAYLWGFYEGYAESYLKSEPHIFPFFKHVSSNNLVYGFWDGQFFENIFESCEDCLELVAQLERKLSKASKPDLNEVCFTQEIIVNILGS